MDAASHTRKVAAALVVAPPYVPDMPDGVEDYVQRFAEVWARPESAESFTRRFIEYVDPEIRLVQHWLFYPTGTGLRSFRNQFRRYFTALPDLSGEVIRWAAMGDTIWIELELTCWHDRRPLSFRVIDRTVIRDGRAVERRVYGGPGRLLAGILTRPRTWPRAVRALLAR
ncbi:MAG TPA: nuclear transport factor 2 family protein [Thermoleophilaceae bacterium]|jgi:hypothetical protein